MPRIHFLSLISCSVSHCHQLITAVSLLSVILFAALLTSTVISSSVSEWRTTQTHFYVHMFFSLPTIFISSNRCMLRIKDRILNRSSLEKSFDWLQFLSNFLVSSDHVTFLSNESHSLKQLLRSSHNNQLICLNAFLLLL